MRDRIPEMFLDAKEVLERSLSEHKLILSRYNSSLENMCQVTHYYIKEESNTEHIGSLELLISYREHIITKYDKFETLNKTQTLTILTSKGDPIWPHIMISKVWNGCYPSALAINKETGVVYFIFLEEKRLRLMEFAMLKENQLECVEESLNEMSPYRIRLDEDAMFSVLGEQEGYRKLYETLFVEFDCGVKFRVYSENK